MINFGVCIEWQHVKMRILVFGGTMKDGCPFQIDWEFDIV